MAYSRNRYALGIFKEVPRSAERINKIFYGSLRDFLKKINFIHECNNFYVLRKSNTVFIIAEFQYGCLMIEILEDTNDTENSIHTKDEIFFF